MQFLSFKRNFLLIIKIIFAIVMVCISCLDDWLNRFLHFLKQTNFDQLACTCLAPVKFSLGAYHLTEKSGWVVKSIMVSDLPVYRRNATSVTVWIQKKDDFVSRESGTNKELRNWLMVSNILFGSYQPEWTDYLKTYSSIFGWNFRKVTLPFTSHPEFLKFSVKW